MDQMPPGASPSPMPPAPQPMGAPLESVPRPKHHLVKWLIIGFLAILVILAAADATMIYMWSRPMENNIQSFSATSTPLVQKVNVITMPTDYIFWPSLPFIEITKTKATKSLLASKESRTENSTSTSYSLKSLPDNTLIAPGVSCDTIPNATAIIGSGEEVTTFGSDSSNKVFDGVQIGEIRSDGTLVVEINGKNVEVPAGNELVWSENAAHMFSVDSTLYTVKNYGQTRNPCTPDFHWYYEPSQCAALSTENLNKDLGDYVVPKVPQYECYMEMLDCEDIPDFGTAAECYADNMDDVWFKYGLKTSLSICKNLTGLKFREDRCKESLARGVARFDVNEAVKIADSTYTYDSHSHNNVYMEVAEDAGRNLSVEAALPICDKIKITEKYLSAELCRSAVSHGSGPNQRNVKSAPIKPTFTPEQLAELFSRPDQFSQKLLPVEQQPPYLGTADKYESQIAGLKTAKEKNDMIVKLLIEIKTAGYNYSKRAKWYGPKTPEADCPQMVGTASLYTDATVQSYLNVLRELTGGRLICAATSNGMAVAAQMLEDTNVPKGTYKCTDTLGRMTDIKLSARGYAFDISTGDNRFTCRVDNPRAVWQTAQ